MLMILFGLLCTAAAILPLCLKYRVVLSGERCKGRIIGIAEQRGGYSVGGYAVKKCAYLVQIGRKQYLTATAVSLRPWEEKRSGKRSGCSGMKPMGGKYSSAGIFVSSSSPSCSCSPRCFAFCTLEEGRRSCLFLEGVCRCIRNQTSKTCMTD